MTKQPFALFAREVDARVEAEHLTQTDDDGWVYEVEPYGSQWAIVAYDAAGNLLGHI
jgi:hypothetical protein